MSLDIEGWQSDGDVSKVTQAVMPKGSVFYWLQSTIHRGGANTALTPRSGLFVS
jgi:hypothetical protein